MIKKGNVFWYKCEFKYVENDKNLHEIPIAFGCKNQICWSIFNIINISIGYISYLCEGLFT